MTFTCRRLLSKPHERHRRDHCDRREEHERRDTKHERMNQFGRNSFGSSIVFT